MNVELHGLEERIREIVREEVAAVLALEAPAEWLSSAEAAAFLGLSIGQVRNLVSEGRLPRHGPRGHRLRFRRSELDAYCQGY